MLHSELYIHFFQANRLQPLEPSQYTLYLTLLTKWIDNNLSPFECSTNELLKEVNMSRATINRTKILLKEAKLIDYSSDKGGTTKFTIFEIKGDFIPLKKEEILITQPIFEAPKIEQPLETVEKVETPPILEAEEKDKVEKTATLPKGIPSFDKVIEFAKTIPIYDESLEPHLRIKYDTWIDAGWKNGFGGPITNWKGTVRNSIPHLKKTETTAIPSTIPNIKKPINTYDE